jgi:AcrR family transcriptional regulator
MAAPVTTRAVADKFDKREAILAAALRLIARSGLHDTPMSAVAREAGVAAGTLYLYFPSKEAMINVLYLELVQDRYRAMVPDGSPLPASPGDEQRLLWEAWHGLARWHLDHPDGSSVIQQCEASGILTPETRDTALREQADGFTSFDEAVAEGRLRDLPRPLFYALFAGPILVLAQLRDSGEIEVSDEVLRATFAGVCRSVLPAGDDGIA